MAQKYKNKKETAKKPSFVSAPATAPKTKERKTFAIPSKASFILPIICIAVFAGIASYFLIEKNSDMLFMAQSKSRFFFDQTFWEECLKVPGAALSWISSYLTQYLYEPTLGASIMIGMWVVLFFAAKFVFKVKNEWSALILLPLTALLVTIIQTGYWIYYIKFFGYWFSGTVGLLAAMILTWIGMQSFFIDRKYTLVNAGYILLAVLSILCYRYFGTYGLLPFLYIPIIEMFRGNLSRNGLIATAAISLLVLIVIPQVAHNMMYNNIRADIAWTYSVPAFQSDNVTSSAKQYPFFAAMLTPILLAFVQKRKNKGSNIGALTAFCSLIVTVGILIGSYIIADEKNIDNYNYHAEMRMYRAIDEQRWDDALEEMASIPGDASREMVLLKNIALFNNGHMGDKMFKYNNMGEPPYVDDSLYVHMVQTAAPIIYYNHGKVNFSYRWCIENSVEFGFSFDNLKNLTRCSIINHEWEVARKYIDILKKTIYYKDWAEHLEKLVDNPSTFADYHEFDNVYELYSHMGSVLDGDNGLCEMYVLNYFANTQNKDSKLLQELTLNYAMVQKDIQLFWPRFMLYAQLHNGEKMPVHYQEAAYLYGCLEPQTMDISRMPFDESIIKKYEDFQQTSQSLLRTGLNAQDVGKSMKATFGDTFYWFYFFCRDIHSY